MLCRPRSLCQFHQHFMRSFYACWSQKGKKDSQLKQLLELLGSVGVKAAHKHVGEIDHCGEKNFFLSSTRASFFPYFVRHLTLTLPLATHALFSLSLYFKHTLTHLLSLSLSISHTHTRTRSLSLFFLSFFLFLCLSSFHLSCLSLFFLSFSFFHLSLSFFFFLSLSLSL